MPLKVELHTHTADDPVDWIPHTARQLIDRAAELSYDAVAITLHDRQFDVEPLGDYAGARGVILIPGVERTIDGRHILLINFSARAATVGDYGDIASLKRDGAASVGLVELPRDHAFANIRLTDNIVQFSTKRYRDNPLVVQGPGAGPEVTAAGVFADLLRVAASLGARV